MKKLSDYDEDYFANLTVAGVIARGVGVILVIAALVLGIGWLSGWFREAADVTGPGNVSSQYHLVINDWEAMITETQNACTADQQAGVGTAQSPTMLEDPAFAYAATYRKTRTDFNTRQQDIFEAKEVGPRGYPRTVNPFPEENSTPPNWCAVATKLEAIHQ